MRKLSLVLFSLVILAAPPVLAQRTNPLDGQPEVRRRMLGEYVFTSILALEAAKKGYDTESIVTPAVEYARRQTIAALYLRRELKDNADPKAQNELAAKLLTEHAVRIFNEAIPAP